MSFELPGDVCGGDVVFGISAWAVGAHDRALTPAWEQNGGPRRAARELSCRQTSNSLLLVSTRKKPACYLSRRRFDGELSTWSLKDPFIASLKPRLSLLAGAFALRSESCRRIRQTKIGSQLAVTDGVIRRLALSKNEKISSRPGRTSDCPLRNLDQGDQIYCLAFCIREMAARGGCSS
jgi:hypothetical protein